jgi:hypothetical protein
MFRKSSKSVSRSIVTVSPDPLSLTPSSTSTIKTPENIEEDPGDPESADEGDIQRQYSFD